MEKSTFVNTKQFNVINSDKKNIELKIRHACMDDINNVFDLSNDEAVRQNSVNQNYISWGEHKKWFMDQLSNPKFRFYIIHTPENQFVGQVRFELNSNIATINISIVREFRGQGLATGLIGKSSKNFFSENLNIEKIHAFIKSDNIASVRSFQKCGYVLNGFEYISGTRLGSFILNRDEKNSQ